MTAAGSDRTRNSLIAVALAALFTFAWTWRDWANLSALRLPDTDDAVRLQQWRDWLGGQGFADLTQYRLGDELALHWSRLPDLVPAGLVALLTPLTGRHAAELAAVIAWPGLLFAAALLLTGRIARVMQGSVPTALVIAALAFPASALFLPGRIDHHGVQLVLLLGAVAALLHPRGTASGIAIGLAVAASLAVGVETAPFLALALALPVIGWIANRPGSAPQMLALGGGLAAGLLVARVAFATIAFAVPACDGFTWPVWLAALAGAAALLALAALARFAEGRGERLGLALAVATLAAVAVLWFAPVCLAPYGGVDPALAARWLANVGEAQPLFAAHPSVVIGQCGLMLAGLAAGLTALRRTSDPGWAILLLFQGVALAIALWQLRGATAGALLAAPALAWLVGVARARGTLVLAGAWVVSAGVLYPLAATALVPPRPEPGPGDCAGPAQLAALAQVPPGRIAGPIDLGAWGLVATRHSFLAAPYHRNNAGNAVAFAILDGPRDRALATAQAWRVEYVAVCGAAPRWLSGERAVLRSGALALYRIPGLPPTAPAP